MIRKISFLILFTFLCAFQVHKFYVSITQIHFNPKNESLEIVTRVFIDDLQAEINDINHTNIELATDREPKNINSIYQKYLQNTLTFSVDDDELEFKYIGSEYENDQVVFYLEIEKIKTFKKLKIENKLLNQLFSEQQNIVKASAFNIDKSDILTPNKTIALINF